MSTDEIGLWRAITHLTLVTFLAFSRMARTRLINKAAMRAIILGGGCLGEIVHAGMWLEAFVVLSIDGDRKEVADSLTL